MPAPSARRPRRSPARSGADVHVRAEGAVDGGLDARMAQLQAQCPTWVAGPDRARTSSWSCTPRAEREASVFYGAGQADALELRWEHAVDTMGPRFAAGDYTGGVLTGLDVLGVDPPVAYTPTFSPTSYDDVGRETSSAGVPPVIWIGLVVLVVVAAVRVAQFVSTGQWDDDGDDDASGSSGWTSSSSRRSWSSAGRRRSSSSSAPAHRAGGARPAARVAARSRGERPVTRRCDALQRRAVRRLTALPTGVGRTESSARRWPPTS